MRAIFSKHLALHCYWYLSAASKSCCTAKLLRFPGHFPVLNATFISGMWCIESTWQAGFEQILKLGIWWFLFHAEVPTNPCHFRPEKQDPASEGNLNPEMAVHHA